MTDEETASGGQSIEGKVEKHLIDLLSSTEFEKLNSYYSQETIFNVLGVERLEVPHSNFLAWLLRNESSHGLATYGLRKFLQMATLCGRRMRGKIADADYPVFDPPTPSLEAGIISGAFGLTDVTVTTEESSVDPNDPAKKGRIDIYVECDICPDQFAEKPEWMRLLIAIENKVKSKEQGDQTNRYWRDLKKRRQDREDERNTLIMGVFLTPLHDKDLEQLVSPQCGCKSFVQVNYEHVSKYVLAPCINRCSDPRSELLLSQYSRSLGLPSLSNSSFDKNRPQLGEMVMAYSEEERSLLANFWNAHKPVILAVLDAYSEELSDVSMRSKRGRIAGVSGN